MNMTLEQFNQQYKYKSDLEKYNTSLFDIWEIPKLENGIYYGDCESYCRFLKENIEQFKNWNYYYCKLNGVGHCVLIKGRSIIDCNVQKVTLLESYSTMYNLTGLKKYGILTVLFKILFSMAYVPLHKLFER